MSAPLKIAMVSEHANPLAAVGGVDAGGQNVHVAALACALAADGHHVTVYTRRDDAAAPKRVELAPGVIVEHVPAGPTHELPKDQLLSFMPEFGRYLGQRFGDDRPDVVHAHFWMSGLAARRAVARIKVPLIQTFHALGVVKRRHQGDADTSPSSRIDLERLLAATVDRVIATSSDEVFELVRLGADWHKLTVVPCGVDAQRFATDGDIAPRTTRPRVLSLGRLVPRKGVDVVIRALAALPDAELVIAGGPQPQHLDTDAEVQRLRAIARDSGVADRVIFVGQIRRADAPALIRSADVVACTPWYEPFGLVPLEAMACGRPVVATAVGGLVDTVVDGVTGLLVPSGQPPAVAGALATLLADAALRRRLGMAGRHRVESRYTWAHVATATAHVYADEANRPASVAEATW